MAEDNGDEPKKSVSVVMYYDEDNFDGYFNLVKAKCATVKNINLLRAKISADPITEFLKTIIDKGGEVPDSYTRSKHLVFEDPVNNGSTLLGLIKQNGEGTEAARAQLQTDWCTWQGQEVAIYQKVLPTLAKVQSLLNLVPFGAGRALLKKLQDTHTMKQREEANQVLQDKHAMKQREEANQVWIFSL